MKIERIDSFLAGNGYILQIHTDNGISGLGQTAYWGYPEAVEAIVKRFQQYLIGQNPLRIEHHWQYLHRMSPFKGNAPGALWRPRRRTRRFQRPSGSRFGTSRASF